MPADPQRTNEEKYFCTHCGASLPQPSSGPSGEVECPECSLQTRYLAPPEQAQAEPSEHPEVLKFYCTFCNQKLSAPSVFAGKEFDCPNCSRANTVPGEPSSEPPPRDLLKFFCTCCGQKLSVGQDLIGHTIECPMCDGATLVPEEGVPLPKAPAKLTRPADLPKKQAPRPVLQTPGAPASRTQPAQPAQAGRPTVPKPGAAKPPVPKPAAGLAPPPETAPRPAAEKPTLRKNGASPPPPTLRPASNAAARKSTPTTKRTAAPPLPKKT